MGIGNYTETDIKKCARAFTGWTFEQPIPLYPYGHYHSRFVYNAEDHDDSEKTFLGKTGRFNGEDIVDIIVRQEATARFISRHLYNFFVADEQQVPAWSVTDPRDPEAIATLMQAFRESDARHPLDVAGAVQQRLLQGGPLQPRQGAGRAGGGVIKLAGTYRDVEPGLTAFDGATRVMGQTLMDPPDGRGLAHRQGVDRRRHADRASQLRGQPGQRRHQARPAGHRPADRGVRPPAGTGRGRRQRAWIWSGRSRSSPRRARR